MDMRTGVIYGSLETARAAGVPEEHAAEIDPVIVRVTTGPFKGRVYERTRTGLRRIDRAPHDEAR